MHVIHQLRTSLHATSLKCAHGTYEPTSLVSPHESNRTWTSPLISSRVHHHPWTYPFMALQAYPKPGPTQQVMQNISQRTMPLHLRLSQPKRRSAKWQYRPHGGSTSPPGVTTHKTSLFPTIACRFTLHRQALHQCDTTGFRYSNSFPRIQPFNSQTSSNQHTHSYIPHYNISTHMHLSSISTHSSLL